MHPPQSTLASGDAGRMAARTLMLLLQMLAAHLAGVREIVFHLGSASGRKQNDESLVLYVASIIARLAEAEFAWGADQAIVCWRQDNRQSHCCLVSEPRLQCPGDHDSQLSLPISTFH